MQAPELSQLLAPQMGSDVWHLAVQHIPPRQSDDVQSSSSVQEPVEIFVTHLPPLQEKPLAQSALELQLARHAIPELLHPRLSGQGVVAELQAPVASQLPIVSLLPEQAGVPHGLPTG
jgi:hypothetical protein